LIVEAVTAGYAVLLPLYQPAEGAALVPTFPGFVLVRFDHADFGWREIVADEDRRWRLLGADNEHPHAVPDAEVERLRRDYGPQGEAATWQPPPPRARLRAGARVDLEEGPFQGCKGSVVEDRGETVVVLVEMFGRSTPCEVPVSAVVVVVA